MTANWMLADKRAHQAVIHLHMLLTAAAVAMFFSYEFFGNFYMIFGNHTVFYPFFGLYLAAELDRMWLALFCLIFWGVYIIALIVTYLIAVLWKKYGPLMVVSWIDTVFSSVMLVVGAVNAGLYRDHVILFAGVLLSGAFGVYLYRIQKGTASDSAA